MKGYPGDEHVISVVLIVLARSPDCNTFFLVDSCVLAAELRCVSFLDCVLHLSGFCVTVWCCLSVLQNVIWVCAHSPAQS